MIKEKRKYIRLDAKLDFIYKIRGARGSGEKGATKNISPAGICGLLNKQIKKGDWLELNMRVPTVKDPMPAVAKVIWTAGEEAGKIVAGIKFEKIDAETKNKFMEYICELMFSKLERLRV